jgi:hypothetical protein
MILLPGAPNKGKSVKRVETLLVGFTSHEKAIVALANLRAPPPLGPIPKKPFSYYSDCVFTDSMSKMPSFPMISIPCRSFVIPFSRI